MHWLNRNVGNGDKGGRKKAFVLCAAMLNGFAALSVHAAGAWVWVDGNGRKVYSDLPPPASVAERQIIQRPGMPTIQPPAAEQPAATAAKPAGNLPASTPAGGQPADKATPGDDKKRKEAAQAEEARRQATEAKNAEIRADNCKRAQASLSTLNSGRRLVTTNEQGQQITLTASDKAEEASRLERIISENCR